MESTVVSGDVLYLPFHTKNGSSGAKAAAASTPTVTLYAEADFATASDGISMTVTAVTGKTGAYAASKDTSGLAVGRYIALAEYTVSSVDQQQVLVARIV